MPAIVAIRLPKLQFLITGTDGLTRHITAKEMDRAEGRGSAKKLCDYPLVRTYTAAVFDREPDGSDYSVTGMGLISIMLGTMVKYPDRKPSVRFKDLFAEDYSHARDWFKRIGPQVILQEASKTDGYDRAEYRAAMQQMCDDFERLGI